MNIGVYRHTHLTVPYRCNTQLTEAGGGGGGRESSAKNRGENNDFDLGASRAPSLSNLGALTTICGPYCSNVKYFSHFLCFEPWNF